MPDNNQLPYALYTAAQVRALDRVAIECFDIPGITLMERAGLASFKILQNVWPDAKVITIVCGAGNNGGDGFIVARLAYLAGYDVHVLQCGDVSKIKGDALIARQSMMGVGVAIQPFDGVICAQTAVIVDAIFGTGLEREVTGEWAQTISAMNQSNAQILAIDIPSGLHSDSGAILGIAIEAAHTVSFIGLKQGMYTGQGPQCCGTIHFDHLAVPAKVYRHQILSASRGTFEKYQHLISKRSRTAHKGHYGHVLVVGGDVGYSGAALMAAMAAARMGAGLVSVATRKQHAAVLNAIQPEIMCHPVEDSQALSILINRATVIALGPGLGQSEWAKLLFNIIIKSKKMIVMDADGLNLLSQDSEKSDDWVLTPHPGEAARLLNVENKQVQGNRLLAAHSIQQKYGGIVVLKGAGSIIDDGVHAPIINQSGNPGMATGGMGDILTGMIAGLIAQHYDLKDAVTLAVTIHGAAADLAAEAGEIGMMATDLLPFIRKIMND